MSEVDTPWAALASRVIRVALVRADVSYAALAEALASMGVKETERSLIARVSRGTIKLTLLLQIIQATEATSPVLWQDAFKMAGTWEARAGAVTRAELAAQPWVSPDRLVQRLADIGTNITEQALVSQLSEGTLSLALFLQCTTVLRSSSLDGYVEEKHLIFTAQKMLNPSLK